MRTPPLPVIDLQESPPPISVSLSRVGIARSAKAIRTRLNGIERSVTADLRCYVDLGPRQKGAHMSRFEEGVNAAIDDMSNAGALRVDALASQLALAIAALQHAHRAEVHISVDYPVTRRTPVSDMETQEMYEVFGIAAAAGDRVRRVLGVGAQGMNACPCAQDLIREQAQAALTDDGFTTDEIARIVRLVPIATHNQRARGRLYVGTPDGHDISPEMLIEVVEDSMSSEIYELLKRTDERYIVDRAHRRPRFVEDSVREMLGALVDRYPDLPDDTFVRAHQANFETIHAHDVEAERYGLLGEIRTEIRGQATEVLGTPVTLGRWLDGVCQ